MKENKQRLSYERAEFQLILLSDSDVISCSGWLGNSDENYDNDGWT